MSDDIKQKIETELAGGSCAASEPLALQVIGDSMEPEFKDGNIIIIDRDGVVRDQCFVLALIDGGYTLRQLVMEDDRLFIQPLNPDYMHERQQVTADAIKGVVVQQSPPNGRRKERKFYNQTRH